ncbi:MAG: helix-turn-helix domain-containing protein, partial [Bacteroidales bacterium]
REIDEDTLRYYLPKVDMEKLPAVNGNDKESGLYGSERELLYQVIFEMRKELNELKNIVYSTIAQPTPVTTQSVALRKSFEFQPLTDFSEPDIESVHAIHNVQPIPINHMVPAIKKEVPASHEYVEETLSLEEMERELIRQALIRNNGKRKKAADELKISERTLYRKIKEYDLE